MHITNTLIINRPVSETFAFISNFENMPKWNYFVAQTIGWRDSRVSSAVRDNLAKLKELLETGQVRLQDGRVETVSS
jgi:uncharacterized membrane protein